MNIPHPFGDHPIMGSEKFLQEPPGFLAWLIPYFLLWGLSAIFVSCVCQKQFPSYLKIKVDLLIWNGFSWRSYCGLDFLVKLFLTTCTGIKAVLWTKVVVMVSEPSPAGCNLIATWSTWYLVANNDQQSVILYWDGPKTPSSKVNIAELWFCIFNVMVLNLR